MSQVTMKGKDLGIIYHGETNEFEVKVPEENIMFTVEELLRVLTQFILFMFQLLVSAQVSSLIQETSIISHGSEKEN